MVVKNRILDGKGAGYEAHVTSEHALLITQYPCPPLLPQKNKIFRQYLTDDGLSTGNYGLDVDGSATEQAFYVKADGDDDRYISQLNAIVGYGGASILGDWCDSGGVLANGFELYYEDTEGNMIDIHDAITSNGDLVRLGVIGISATWEIRNFLAANDYGYIVSIPLYLYMPPYGVKLDRGTNQKIVMAVRDNNLTATSGCDIMNMIAHGFDRFR